MALKPTPKLEDNISGSKPR